MKRSIIEEVSLFLLKQGYMLKTLSFSFDIMARKGDKTLIIKILKDANATDPPMMRQMQDIASYVDGVPLIIAESAGMPLEDNVIYSRSGVVTLSPGTFISCIEGELPYFRSSRAGFTANLDGGRLKAMREDEGYSINNLARKMGVSTSMISRYESNDAEITYSKALKMHDLFGEDVFRKLDIFQAPNMNRIEASSDISLKYASLGFNVLETIKAPFDMIARENNHLILTSVGDNINTEVVTLSNMLDTDKLIVFKSKKPNVDAPIIAREDFMEFEKSKEIIKFLKEF